MLCQCFVRDIDVFEPVMSEKQCWDLDVKQGSGGTVFQLMCRQDFSDRL